VDYVGKVIPSFPDDQDNIRPALIIGALVDPVTMEVINFLPFTCVDNGDGTATLVISS